jgi:hypothetical protein
MKRRLAVFAIFAFSFTFILIPQARSNPVEILSEAWAENCGRLTIAPGGGENLVDPALGNDYRIHLDLWESGGNPIVGMPGGEMWVLNEDLLVCPGGYCYADGPTDENGHTTFSGTIMGGTASDGLDCDQTLLYVYLWGELLNDGEPVCVSTNSPDLDGDLSVGIPDFARFVQDFNCESSGEPCNPCHDYNEDGKTGVEDFAIFAGYFNSSACR